MKAEAEVQTCGAGWTSDKNDVWGGRLEWRDEGKEKPTVITEGIWLSRVTYTVPIREADSLPSHWSLLAWFVHNNKPALWAINNTKTCFLADFNSISADDTTCFNGTCSTYWPDKKPPREWLSSASRSNWGFPICHFQSGWTVIRDAVKAGKAAHILWWYYNKYQYQ